jgi:Xaa-Pro aminopeptidase
MYLQAEWSAVERRLGLSLKDHFLMAIRSFDNTKSVTPFILDVESRHFGLFPHVENGNVEAVSLPGDMVPLFYNPYFTLGPHGRASNVFETLEAAVEHAADGDTRLEVDPHLPIGVTHRLSKRFSIKTTKSKARQIFATPILQSDVLFHANALRVAGATCAIGLLDRSPRRAELSRYLDERTDRRFSLISDLLHREGLGALLVSSVLNVQELAGVPMRALQRPMAALYTHDGQIWLLDVRPSGEHFKDFSSLSDAFATLARGPIGVEVDAVETWLFAEIGLQDHEWRAADRLLREWRDRNTLCDLGFYIIAGRASATAIEKSLTFAKHNVDAGHEISELDAFAVYEKTLTEYVAEHAPFLNVARTLTNYHSGSRTIFPANPAKVPLNRSSNMLKVDAGCLLFDTNGRLLSCSDVARTACFDSDGGALYETFRESVVNDLIPSCQAQRPGREIHRRASNALDSMLESLSLNPLTESVARPIAYDRDVGHLLGRNNLAHLRFTKEEEGTLREGMIACCEYQWPIAEHAIAYEDTGLVTPMGGLNFTSDL